MYITSQLFIWDVSWSYECMVVICYFHTADQKARVPKKELTKHCKAKTIFLCMLAVQWLCLSTKSWKGQIMQSFRGLLWQVVFLFVAFLRWYSLPIIGTDFCVRNHVLQRVSQRKINVVKAGLHWFQDHTELNVQNWLVKFKLCSYYY